MTKIMNVEILEAPICFIPLGATQEETEVLKREEVCPRPLSSLAAEVGLGHDCPDSQRFHSVCQDSFLATVSSAEEQIL